MLYCLKTRSRASSIYLSQDPHDFLGSLRGIVTKADAQDPQDPQDNP